MVVVKCCSGCGVVKSLDDFHRDRRTPDGRRSRCKECVSARSRMHYEENREKVLEYKRQYREENRDKAREYGSRYYEKNRNKVLERHRRYREENRDKVAEIDRRWREENRDKIAEKDRRYREENLEYVDRRRSRLMSRYQSVTETSSTKSGTWSEAEVAILMADDGRTMVAKALELGRTYNSCHNKREYLRRTGATN